MSKPDISIVLTAHREGALLLPTLRSLDAAIERAMSRGSVECELIAVLDSADRETTEILRSREGKGTRVAEIDVSDPGVARNHGLQMSAGAFLGVIDGDNLVTDNWLDRCLSKMRELPDGRWVLHPELEIGFGKHDYFRRNVDQRSPSFSPWAFLAANYWDTLSFARREVYLETPYSRTLNDFKLGFEDWNWNMEVILKGGVHVPVGGTVHFKRSKYRDSVNEEEVLRDFLVLPTTYFKRTSSSMPAEETPPEPSSRQGALSADIQALAGEVRSMEPAISPMSRWAEIPDLTPGFDPWRLWRYRDLYEGSDGNPMILSFLAQGLSTEEAARVVAMAWVHKKPKMIKLSRSAEIEKIIIEKYLTSLSMSSSVSIADDDVE